MIYDLLSYGFQFVISILLIIGIVILIKPYVKGVWVVAFFLFGCFVLETLDLIYRFFDINTENHINYAINQFLFFIGITEIYATYLLKVSKKLKIGFYLLAILFFYLNVFSTGIVREYSGYSYVLVCCILCGFAITYFSNVLNTGAANKFEIRFNVITLFFFSVEALMAITYNFLIANYLDWVGPIWLFRVGLLIVFYITLIWFTWSLGKNKL